MSPVVQSCRILQNFVQVAAQMFCPGKCTPEYWKEISKDCGPGVFSELFASTSEITDHDHGRYSLWSSPSLNFFGDSFIYLAPELPPASCV